MTRELVSFRLGEGPKEKIADLQAEYDAGFTLVMRALLAVAFAHLPEARKLLESNRRLQ